MIKTKVSFSIDPKRQAEAECLKKIADCNSMSEFYEKAVQFYVMHLHVKNNENYFGDVVVKTLEGMLEKFSDRIVKMQFKDTVSVVQLFLLMAREYDWSQEYVNEIYGKAVAEAKRITSTGS